MTLDECYDALGLKHPLEFEREVYDSSIFRQELGRKKIGSTTHMAIEAALDWYAFKERGLERKGWWRLLLSEERDEQDILRKTLSALRDLLGDIDESWFLIQETSSFNGGIQETSSFRGSRMSDMVYVDHHLIDHDTRITGPFRMVRSVVETQVGEFSCFNRDRQLVARVDNLKAMKSVLTRSPLPIHVSWAGGQKSLFVAGREYDP